MPPSPDGYSRASPPSQKHGLGGAWAESGFGEAGLTCYAITSLPVQSLVGLAWVSIALLSSSLLLPFAWVGRYAAWRYTSPVASNAQSVRACLLARATAATCVPRRARSCCSQTLRVSFFPSTRRMTAMAPWSTSRRRYGLPRVNKKFKALLAPPPGAVHCTAERGTARRALVRGAAEVPWEDGGGMAHGIGTHRGGETAGRHARRL